MIKQVLLPFVGAKDGMEETEAVMCTVSGIAFKVNASIDCFTQIDPEQITYSDTVPYLDTSEDGSDQDDDDEW